MCGSSVSTSLVSQFVCHSLHQSSACVTDVPRNSEKRVIVTHRLLKKSSVMVAEFGLVTRRKAKSRKKASGEAWVGSAKREFEDENLEPCDEEARLGSLKEENEYLEVCGLRLEPRGSAEAQFFPFDCGHSTSRCTLTLFFEFVSDLCDLH